MEKIFTQVILLFTLCWGFGCSPKPAFYLDKGTRSFENYQNDRRNQTPKVKVLVSASEADGLTNINAGNKNDPAVSAFTASSQPVIQIPPLGSQAAISPLDYETIITRQIPPQPAGRLAQKIIRKQNLLTREFLTIADTGKPTHKLADWGFLLGLGAFLFTLIGILTGAGLPFLVSFLVAIAGIIISSKGLSKIKKAPDQYGGKGYALTGLILSGLILLLFAAFLLFVLSFAGAFT